MEFHHVLEALEALDGHLVAQPGHHDLAVARLAGALHREQVAVHDAGVAHRHAAHLEQVVGAVLEQRALDVVGLVHMLLRQDGCAGRDAAHQRQRELRQSGNGQGELRCARFLQVAQRLALEPDAARRAAHQFDHALAGQRLQVLLGRVGGLEAQFGGDLGPRGRRAGARHRAADELEDLLLAGGKLDRSGRGHFKHGGCGSIVDARTVCTSSICIFNQFSNH